MKNEDKLQELENKIIKGLEEAYRKMVIFKKQKNSPLIVSRNGKVVEIAPDDIPPTTSYKR
tara:strand:+ start:12129 stop:12311 length:183 start_codon:yes stop_codon:yes gene_type:complete